MSLETPFSWFRGSGPQNHLCAGLPPPSPPRSTLYLGNEPRLSVRPGSSSLWIITHVLSFVGFVDSTHHHSSHSAVLSSPSSSTTAPPGVKAEPSSNCSSLPAPQSPLQEAAQARPGRQQAVGRASSLPSPGSCLAFLQRHMFPLLGAYLHQILGKNQKTILIH